LTQQVEPLFVMFSWAHIGAIMGLLLGIILLFLTTRKWLNPPKHIGQIERLFAVTLLIMEVLYHMWLVQTDRWNLSGSLPLELCSISLVLTIILLWTGNKHVYDVVFYAGIGGALQAIATPVLDLSFPHFRYFHFFYTHIGIIITALYFTWVKGYRPTFKGVLKTMVVLNVLFPLIFAVNVLVDGNYMFLRTKPSNGSLLDFLGPYPWYILSLEIVTFLIFVGLWFVFRKKEKQASQLSESRCSMKKGIIFGVSGTIGKTLNQTLTISGYEIYGTYYLHFPKNLPKDKVFQLPVGKAELLDALLSNVKPDFVIMALRGDFERQLEFHEQVARYLKNHGGRMVFCSTSNVFDGETESPHFEDDQPKAQSDYGQYKIECERLLTEILGNQLTIVRIPAIYGHETPRIQELLQQLEQGKTIKVYTNLYSTANSDVMLAKQIDYLLKQQLPGIYHLGTSDVMNHAEFTRKLVAQWGFTNVHFEELQIADSPIKYDNSLLTKHTIPLELQLTYEQLLTNLASPPGE